MEKVSGKVQTKNTGKKKRYGLVIFRPFTIIAQRKLTKRIIRMNKLKRTRKKSERERESKIKQLKPPAIHLIQFRMHLELFEAICNWACAS